VTDITTVWMPEQGRGDWALLGAQLQSGSDLATAVLISFFSDRAAKPGDVIPDGTGNRRGWPCNDDPQFPLGSRLWLLSRAKQTQKTLQDAQDYLQESVAWLIADLVVSRFDIQASWARPGMLSVVVTAFMPDGTVQPLGTYNWVWKDF
jgi:phage gp46-like protein